MYINCKVNSKKYNLTENTTKKQTSIIKLDRNLPSKLFESSPLAYEVMLAKLKYVETHLFTGQSVKKTIK